MTHFQSFYLIRPYLLSIYYSLLVLLISVLPIAYARYSRKISLKYLSKPRTLYKKYKPWAKRAQWAHENSFESFIIHCPSVLIAISLILSGITLPYQCTAAAMLHPIFRFIYIIMYIINRPILRIISWGGALGSSLLIYFYTFNELHL